MVSWRWRLPLVFGFVCLARLAMAAGDEVSHGNRPMHTKLIGSVYDERGDTLLFNWNVALQREGAVVLFTSEFLKPETGVLHTLETYREVGGYFKSYKYERKNSGEMGEIYLQDDLLTFRRTNMKNGKPELKVNRRKYPENFVTGAGLFLYIASNIKLLERGQDLSINYGVAELGDYISFTLSVDSSSRSIIRMRPSNILYRMFTDTIYFDYESGSIIPSKITGPLLPLVTIKGKSKRIIGVQEFHAIDGEVVKHIIFNSK